MNRMDKRAVKMKFVSKLYAGILVTGAAVILFSCASGGTGVRSGGKTPLLDRR